MKKYYFVLLRETVDKMTGGIAYCNPMESPSVFRLASKNEHSLQWIIYFNDANNERWDYYWFDKSSDEAFLKFVDAKRCMIQKIFDFNLSR